MQQTKLSSSLSHTHNRPFANNNQLKLSRPNCCSLTAAAAAAAGHVSFHFACFFGASLMNMHCTVMFIECKRERKRENKCNKLQLACKANQNDSPFDGQTFVFKRQTLCSHTRMREAKSSEMQISARFLLFYSALCTLKSRLYTLDIAAAAGCSNPLTDGEFLHERLPTHTHTHKQHTVSCMMRERVLCVLCVVCVLCVRASAATHTPLEQSTPL